PDLIHPGVMRYFRAMGVVKEIAAKQAAVWAGLDPAIHVHRQVRKTWMPGSSPGMTTECTARIAAGYLLSLKYGSTVPCTLMVSGLPR
ncbi:hypothetical protein ABTK18_19475, partial [Acinetobacter baumannii]